MTLTLEAWVAAGISLRLAKERGSRRSSLAQRAHLTALFPDPTGATRTSPPVCRNTSLDPSSASLYSPYDGHQCRLSRSRSQVGWAAPSNHPQLLRWHNRSRRSLATLDRNSKKRAEKHSLPCRMRQTSGRRVIQRLRLQMKSLSSSLRRSWSAE